ncbi:putative transcriptional regulatory protein, Crp/Fnr family [uncultured Sphingopyxis sp.]|uniref:Putative transcriptional regulatory protein, Crp/Fnr family n=1 Tax=uncultured Sphingopyxis sp. TaxID=310581 RepID=A0A1Y5Q2P2_9SPHN|nr:Crp/Fnr family transcriptional regulator [uncultured Sphingopyxis sp.]SBV34057.1 putative transcriptional regulatory protein, Crp/Fnr family [uncultured Sphingopyxis sp.]
MPFREILNRLLGPGERVLWEASLARNARDVRRGADILREGERPQALYVVLAGWAQKYRQLHDGRRQIVGIYLPGQICGLDLFTIARHDHSLAAVRHVSIAEVGRAELCDLLQHCPNLSQIFCWSELVAGAIQREWMASIGQRNAIERVAHLMCEMFVRQGGERADGVCDFLLTQRQIAEATGLTQVHVNRMVQELRRRCGAELGQQRLRVPDFSALASIACFDANYLHLGEADRIADLAYPLFDARPEWAAGKRPPVGREDGLRLVGASL